MLDLQGPYRNGALFIGLSGALHLIAPLFDGFGATGMLLFPAGIAYLAIAWGLFKGWRWLAYAAFLIALFGGSIALSYVWSNDAVPAWVFTGITLFDWLCASALFLALWRNPPKAQTP